MMSMKMMSMRMMNMKTRRKKTMTKSILISLIMIMMVIVSFLIYYAGEMIHPQESLDKYNARLEDISSSQAKIGQTLNELNKNIELEANNVKALNDKITKLSEKADLPPPVINTTRTVQGPPQVVTIPVARPTPVSSAS